ncbi:hypothetical protein [Chromobacterium haemolyticum]|uniref:hypothetical protein n=1 Tax=Chromobacterium haemolyticum TaxID=394935 RepID=UPI00244D468D|nr:hypothetical protein [Chromobacterium haemolyticum]MDH0342977.1 hypothetical protein [Chromobacterium haemolyticum]
MALKAQKELELVLRLLQRKGLHAVDRQSWPPPLPDVGATLSDGRRIAFEVTEVHADEHLFGGGKGCLRAREVRQAQQGEDVDISVPNAPIAAIKYRIQAKCVKRYAAKPGYELSLLLAANIPQFGGVAATTLFPAFIQEAALTAATHDLLESSAFERVYLHLIQPGVLYEWSKQEAWVEMAKVSDEGTRPPFWAEPLLGGVCWQGGAS